MKKNLLPWQLLTLAALVLPVLYLLWAWPQLPTLVPMQYGLDGHVNSYGSRNYLWLLATMLPLGVVLLFSVLPRLDPKRRLDGASANFQKLRLVVVSLIGGVNCYTLYLAMHPGAGPGRGLAVALGMFFALLGNYLTTVQPNYFVGIRTPWTLESSAVWARTHRVGGILFCVGGLLLAGLAVVLPLAWVMPMLLAVVLSIAAFSYIYSYVLFRQQANRPGPV